LLIKNKGKYHLEKTFIFLKTDNKGENKGNIKYVFLNKTFIIY
jgi:hypothetical protein